MQQSLATFVLLRFSRLHHEAVDLLVLDSNEGTPLQVWIHPNWKQWLGVEDQTYISELMDEWTHATPAEIPALLDELLQQSQGPLRVVDHGRASVDQCESLIRGLTGKTNSNS